MTLRASDNIVLSLCDRTGVMVAPWLAAGFECWCVDMQHPKGVHRDGLLVRVGVDVTDWLPPRTSYRIAFAFPPCTHLANSGNRWKADKGLDALIEALPIVKACRNICRWTDAPWMLENPIGSLSTYWRKPDYTFQPWNYEGLESKRTCIWSGGGFVMPPFRVTQEPENVQESCFRMSPSADRGNLRSVTPEGFARAVFEANHNREGLLLPA